METQNMVTITASLERSLQNFSLNHNNTANSNDESSNDVGLGRSASTSSSPNERQDENHVPNDTTLELNSHVSLPYYWEQCLDLKTGEIYYINWRNGMRANEDPRTAAEYSGDYYSEEEEEEEEEESSNDSEDSSSGLSPQSSSYRVDQKENVLVVGGCKSCLMYYMVPKHVHDCPKCNGQLLHFGRPENGSQ